MNSILASYGEASSLSWLECQRTLSDILGTTSRICARIISCLHDWQAASGPDRKNQATSPLGFKEHNTVVRVESENQEMPTITTTESDSEKFLTALFQVPTAVAKVASASNSAMDDGDDV